MNMNGVIPSRYFLCLLFPAISNTISSSNVSPSCVFRIHIFSEQKVELYISIAKYITISQI